VKHVVDAHLVKTEHNGLYCINFQKVTGNSGWQVVASTSKGKSTVGRFRSSCKILSLIYYKKKQCPNQPDMVIYFLDLVTLY